jgi:NAD(P)-dependent dehydrogenase (short-subunit alcohol dehydrogenase family)
MDLHLTGKVAVVTGASKGIGLAVAQALAEEGAHVVAGARQPSDDIAQLVERFQAHFVATDLSTPGGPAHLIAEAVATFGGLDILVNNAGAARTRPGGFRSITDDEWLETLTLNFLAAVRTTRAALPHLLDRGAGVIVTICSVNAFLPDPLVMDYCAAKAALANFSKALSKEVGPQGIRVNTVSPGPVATDLWLGKGGVAETVSQASGSKPNEVAQQAAQAMVTGRFTRPQEVADLVLLLASDRAGNVTGADFVIDGGLIRTL